MHAIKAVSQILAPSQPLQKALPIRNEVDKAGSHISAQALEDTALWNLDAPIGQGFQEASAPSSSISSTWFDNNQADEKPGNMSCFQDVLRKFWLWECAGCLLSLICLGVIFGLLIYENGRRLDGWHLAISLNAVVAFIALLAKGSLVMVLSSILSQLKWLDFENAQYLKQLKSFDRASRGPWGSFLFLWKSRRTTILASTTALLMLLALLLDPFVQIVLSFPSELTIDSDISSMFSRSSIFQISEQSLFNGSATVLESIIAGINNGLLNAELQESFTCPSGNCLWSTAIKTLGVYGHCDNVTTELQVKCFNSPDIDVKAHVGASNITTCAYQFPSNRVKEAIGLDYGGFDPGLFDTIWNSSVTLGARVSNDSLVAAGYSLNTSEYLIRDGVLLDFEVLQLPPFASNLLAGQGHVCKLHWCEKTFRNVQVNDGILSYTSATQKLWSVSSPNPSRNLSLKAPAAQFLFLPSQVTDLESSHPSNWAPYQVDDFGIIPGLLAINFNFSYPLLIPGLPAPEIAPRISTLPDLNAAVVKIGESLTEMIRTDGNNTNVPGQTKVLVPIIRVEWAWLALPLALVFVTSILLTIVAIKSHCSGVTVWKDDPLALLLHHVDGIDKDFLGSTAYNGSADIEKLADEIVIRLSKDAPFTFARGNSASFVSQIQLSKTSELFESIRKSGRRSIHWLFSSKQ